MAEARKLYLAYCLMEITSEPFELDM